MTDIHVLIELQRDLLNTVQRLKERFLSKNNSETTRGYIDVLIVELEHLYQTFKFQHDEILRIIRETTMNSSDVPYISEECFYEFSDLYFEFKGKLLDSLPTDATRSPLSSTFAMPMNHGDITASVDARLPKISLPKFSGDYIDWIPFRDIYLSLVHTNPSLSKIQKFYYLKGTLTGEAASLIKTISATEANYLSAWNILETRYHNKRAIVGTIIQKLFNIPTSDGSFQSVKLILDTAHECLSSLENFEIDTSTWDPMVVFILCQKLDLHTRKEWEHSLKSSTEIPSRSEMFSFLERTFRSLESLSHLHPSHSKHVQKPKSTAGKKSYVHNSNISKSKPISCLFCQKNHYLSQCYKFLALPLKSKREFLLKQNICQNCLTAGHPNDNCSNANRCSSCGKLHHTLLYSDEGISVQNCNIIESTSSNSDSLEHFVMNAHNSHIRQNVLLYTIRLYVNSSRGLLPLRALLDPGSQGTLISENAVQLLRLPRQKSHFKIIGVGHQNESVSKYSVKLDLYSRKKQRILSVVGIVLSNISSYKPPHNSRKLSLPKVEVDHLADPLYYQGDRIDIILGSDVCSMVKIPAESFVHGELFFQNTQFGWVFSGSSGPDRTNEISFHNINLENLLRSFWEQEECLAVRDLSTEELACENYFKATTKRDPSGRYIVNLPFRSLLKNEAIPKIHSNIFGALKRFKQLENSFIKRPSFAEHYKEFMLEYELLGHMTKIGTYPICVDNNSYFLPHHGVLKEDSSTTKLRVVFDGSSHMEGRTSLNEELSPGPALQNNLPTILNKWRLHRIAFSADIEKMFRQVIVSAEHRKFQQILWRFNPSDELSIYQLNTVTYGTTSAPFLSIRVLQQLAHDYEAEFPIESRILITESYVDDIISGADTLEQAIRIQRNLCTILSRGGCNLRKWITNSARLLNKIPEENREKSMTLKFDRDNTVKTLGIQWNTSTDSFSFKVNLDSSYSVSKRSILSDTARLFDPLGLLTPSTVIAKAIFKQLWEHSIDWDDRIPNDIEQKWIQYRSALSNFSELKIPRWIHYSTGCKVELHCFCDASTIAYAAAVYVRVNTSDKIFVNLLQAKSKISPMKTISIPRLELCAATLLVKLAVKVQESFSNIEPNDIFYWSDSSTVLSWIKKPPSNWTVYVANRVSEIQRLSNFMQWRYVPSAINPADCASRGMLPLQLMQYQEWWHGPKFLYHSPSEWPKSLQILDTSQERKKLNSSKILVSNTTLSSNENRCDNVYKRYPSFLGNFSKMYKLLRVVSLCLQFIQSLRAGQLNRNSRSIHNPNITAIKLSLKKLIKLTQDIDFPPNIIKDIVNGYVKDKPLSKLMPFIDDEGLIRVGGRLQNSSLSYEVKHPILLSKSNPLSTLIIREAHENTLHGGITLTMAYVSRKYWIISGKQLAKSIIHKCIDCFKYSAKSATQIMGNLPSVRLHTTRPFKHSGVDYAGPISVKTSTLRSAIISKGYICLLSLKLSIWS